MGSIGNTKTHKVPEQTHGAWHEDINQSLTHTPATGGCTKPGQSIGNKGRESHSGDFHPAQIPGRYSKKQWPKEDVRGKDSRQKTAHAEVLWME